MKKTALLLTAAAALFATSVAAQETIAPGANVSVVSDQELPNVPGKSLRAVLVERDAVSLTARMCRRIALINLHINSRAEQRLRETKATQARANDCY